MASDDYDFVIVGGGSAGCALATGSPPTRQPRAGAGGRPPRLPVGRLHPHAGRADLPDRQPVLRLEVRVRARAAHERPADLPRARQGARRLQQHQRHDLPARQPAGLRALGRRPGHGATGTTRTACPTSSGWRTAWPPSRDDPFRGHDGPLVLERGPATNPLFEAFFDRREQAGYPLTDDVNGYRQEGFAPFDRNIRRGRRLSAARAYLHPVMQPAQPHVHHPRVRRPRPLRGQARRRRRVPARRRHQRVSAGEVILCGGAINTPQLLQLSGVGNAADCARSASTSCTTCPASARTCRTTSRSTSSTPARSRCRCSST